MSKGPFTHAIFVVATRWNFCSLQFKTVKVTFKRTTVDDFPVGVYVGSNL